MKRILAAAWLLACAAHPSLAAQASATHAPTARAPIAPMEIEAPGPQGPLRGTLLVPAGARAVVVIVPGSGPTDRDGNSPAGLHTDAYRQLAEALAARGIASVRIDKRGMFGSASAIPDANDVTLAAYAQDVHAWARLVRERLGLKCAWVLGHSEGGAVALVASRDGADLCGLLLVATPGRPMGEVLRAQLDANPANAPILGDAHAAIDALGRGQRVDVSRMHPALQGLFNPAVQGFMIDSFALRPDRELQAWHGPALIVQGMSDLQVAELDARTLAAGAPAAKLVLVPGVNHVLKHVGDVQDNLASYADPARPVAPEVVAAIADFVAR